MTFTVRSHLMGPPEIPVSIKGSPLKKLKVKFLKGDGSTQTLTSDVFWDGPPKIPQRTPKIPQRPPKIPQWRRFGPNPHHLATLGVPQNTSQGFPRYFAKATVPPKPSPLKFWMLTCYEGDPFIPKSGFGVCLCGNLDPPFTSLWKSALTSAQLSITSRRLT